MKTPRIIIRLERGRIKTIHASTWVDVAIIDHKHTRQGDGDEAHLHGLEHETRNMQRVYPRDTPHA